jgi:glucose-6-phosphate isomerase
MSKPLLSADPVYQKIQQYYDANGSKINIKQLFESDAKRFDKYSMTMKTPNDGDILLVSSMSKVIA